MKIYTLRKLVSGITAVLLALLIGTDLISLWLQQRTVGAQARLQRLTLLAAEMRQSSNELTDLARDYAVTGDPQFRERYFNVLDIRSGRRPRPRDDSFSDWRADSRPAVAAMEGEHLPLLDILRAEGVPKETFALLAESQEESDALAALEIGVMDQVEKLPVRGEDEQSARLSLIAKLHDAEHHARKRSIMLAANRFEKAVRGQAVEEIESLEMKRRSVLLLTFLIVGLMLACVVLFMVYAQRAILAPLRSLGTAARRLSEGDYRARAGVGTHNELGLLGKVFDQMAWTFASDIAGRELAVQTLRDSEQRWRTLFECSADAILIIDEKGRIEMANAQTETLFGYSRDDLVGKSVDLLLPPNLRKSHEKHRAAYETAPFPRPMEDRMDLVGMHRDGHLIPLSIGLSAQESLGLKWNLAIVHDLTAQHILTRELRLLSAAVEAAASGIAITDTEARCQWSNRAFEAITGYPREEILGQPMSILKSGVHGDAFFRELWTTITAGRTWHGEIHNRHKDGHTYVEEQTISPVHDANGEITHFIAVKHDVTARKDMEQQVRKANETLQHQLAEIEILQAQLREQAIRDPLTGLFNRRYLTDYLTRHLERSRRDLYPVALLLLDLDHFKQLNDTYGHAAGDVALRVLAELLQSETRVSDTACRYGGEEFIVIMPRASLTDAMRRGDTLRATYEETVIEYEGMEIRGTFSAGVAVFPDHGDDGDAVLSAADRALYQAKSGGRNRVVAFGDAQEGDSIPMLEASAGDL